MSDSRMEDIGELHKEAERAGLFAGPTTSCELELQELMRQIDIMVNNKRKEWEIELQATRMRLKTSESQEMNAKMELRDKSSEVKELHHQLEGMERSQRELVSQYEEQVSKLRMELLMIQKNYSKLQSHQNKEKSYEHLLKELRRTQSELQSTGRELEECNIRCSKLEEENKSCHQRMGSAEKQSKILQEKCDSLNLQCTNYQEQLGKRRQMLEQTDLNFRSRLAHLEGQLQRAQDTLDNKSATIQRMEDLLEEANKQREIMETEKKSLQGSLVAAEAQINALVEEAAENKRKAAHSLTDNQEEIERLRRITSKVKNNLLDKEKLIRTLEVQGSRKQQQINEAQRKRISDLEMELEKYSQSENRWKEEVDTLQVRLEDATVVNSKLKLEHSRKEDELRKRMEETNTVHQQREQFQEIQKQHEEVYQEMDCKINQLTSDLRERDQTIACLSRKVSNQEKQIRDEFHQKGLLEKDLALANMQLQRINESSMLLQQNRRELPSEKRLQADLQELQQLYDECKTENSRLKSENTKLHNQLSDVTEQASRVLPASSPQVTEAMPPSERKQGSSSKDRSLTHHTRSPRQQRISDSSLTSRSSSEHQHKDQSARTKDSEGTLLRDVYRNSVSSGTSPRELTEDERTAHILSEQKDEDDRFSGVGIAMLLDPLENERPDSRQSITATFMAEDRKRAARLEDILDGHIQDLQRKADETIKRHLGKSS